MKKHILKHIMLASAALSCMLSTGCITKSAKPIGNGTSQAWYGRVNYWAASTSDLSKDIAYCDDAGVSGYMIELAGWANSTGEMWTDSWLKTVESRYKTLHSLCKTHGLWLFVSIVNDNMGTGKYGDPGIPLSSVMAQAQKLAQIVKADGSKNVIVQPVAETRTSAGKQFEQYCVANLSGFKLVYNAGACPGGIASGFAYRAWHPSGIDKTVPKDAFTISDHGLFIRYLAADGSLDGPGDPAKLAAWYAKAKANGNPVIGYYAFKRVKPDKSAINALGKAAK